MGFRVLGLHGLKSTIIIHAYGPSPLGLKLCKGLWAWRCFGVLMVSYAFWCLGAQRIFGVAHFSLSLSLSVSLSLSLFVLVMVMGEKRTRTVCVSCPKLPSTLNRVQGLGRSSAHMNARHRKLNFRGLGVFGLRPGPSCKVLRFLVGV